MSVKKKMVGKATEVVAANVTTTLTQLKEIFARNVTMLSQVVQDVNRLICQVNLSLSRLDMLMAYQRIKVSSLSAPNVDRKEICTRRSKLVDANTAPNLLPDVTLAARTVHPVSGARRATSPMSTEERSSAPDARGSERPASLAPFVEAAEIAGRVIGSCLECASKLFSEMPEQKYYKGN